MASKKKRGPNLDELVQRPWCYYCERDFEDNRILISHQKAKHFKCEKCGRRLNTAGGLSVHLQQVHKENLTKVDNALPNRSDPNIEIFAMEGIPEDILLAHRHRIIAQFHQEQADRQAQTGNPPTGAGSNGHVAKKPKVESKGDLKQRLAEFKAKKAEEAAAMQDSVEFNAGQEMGQGADQFPPVSLAYMQQPYPGLQGSPPATFQQPYSQPPFPYPPQSPAVLPPFVQTPPQPHPAFGPPGQQYPPYGQNYTPPQQPPGLPPFQPPFQGGPPRFGSGSPAQALPPHHAPLQNGIAPRPSNLAPAPGLPPRPAFGAPLVDPFEMQQLHQGRMPAENGVLNHQVQQPPTQAHPEMQKYLDDAQQTPSNLASLDGLIPKAALNSETVTPAVQGASGADKKTSSKRTTLVYSDMEISPEEKMAELVQYAFHPAEVSTTIGDVEAKVTARVDETEY